MSTLALGWEWGWGQLTALVQYECMSAHITATLVEDCTGTHV